MKTLFNVILVLMFGYTMYLMNIVNTNKERFNAKSKELSSCTNHLNYYKWMFENMPTDKYLQEQNNSTSIGRWEHNTTISIPINLRGIKTRPP